VQNRCIAFEGCRSHSSFTLDYMPLVGLMKRATVILTDSGGIQEEARLASRPGITRSNGAAEVSKRNPETGRNGGRRSPERRGFGYDLHIEPWPRRKPLGRHAAENIVRALLNYNHSRIRYSLSYRNRACGILAKSESEPRSDNAEEQGQAHLRISCFPRYFRLSR